MQEGHILRVVRKRETRLLYNYSTVVVRVLIDTNKYTQMPRGINASEICAVQCANRMLCVLTAGGNEMHSTQTLNV